MKKKSSTRKYAETLKGKTIQRKSQPTIKIDGGLGIELDLWLKTENAASLGFHSKSDFATEAIRNYMQSVRGPRFTDLVENEDGDYTLVDTYLNLPTKYLVVQVDKKHKEIKCKYCQSDKCDHILYVWKSIASSQRLTSMGFQCNNIGERFKFPV